MLLTGEEFIPSSPSDESWPKIATREEHWKRFVLQKLESKIWPENALESEHYKNLVRSRSLWRVQSVRRDDKGRVIAQILKIPKPM